MIDTIKVKISCPKDARIRILRQSTEYSAVDHATESIKYQVFRASVFIGSFYYPVQITVPDDEDFIYVEMSVPKFLFSHNVLLFSADDLGLALEKLRKDMERYFKITLTKVESWEFFRIDLCYAWKFYDDKVATRVIEYMKTQSYSRKKTANYDTSCMYVGTNSSLKFYLKGPEFYQHDWKRIKLDNIDTALLLLEQARGVVRFEITMRRKALEAEFGPNLLYKDIYLLLTNNNIQSIMQNKLIKLLGITTEPMTTTSVYERIAKGHSARLALQIYSFYRMWTSGDSVDRNSCLSLPYSTRARYRAYLRRLNLGMAEDITGREVSLGIPSEYCVGIFPPL